MRSHVDRYATAGVAKAQGLGVMKGSAPELTPLLYTRHNLQAALDSIRYITMHVVKENEVREVSVLDFVHLYIRNNIPPSFFWYEHIMKKAVIDLTHPVAYQNLAYSRLCI